MIAYPLSYSIIIVTYLRHEFLCSTLRALAHLVDPDVGEIIVVDQCPADSLPVDVMETPGLRYILLDSPGMVKARNVGLVSALGRVVIFLDDDVIPTSKLISAHLGAYADPLVGGVAGRIVGPGQSTPLPPHRYVFDPIDGWRYAHFDHTVPGDVMTARGCNMSFRKELLVQLGGFDPNFAIFRDDSDMCFRVIAAGFLIRFVPGAELIHLNASSGGTRMPEGHLKGYLSKELIMYRQLHKHYKDNLYFIIKHFTRNKKLILIGEAYFYYVGFSRWPWRLVAKNACFLAAFVQAARWVRLSRYVRAVRDVHV